MTEKWHQSKICIEINDKSQGSIAKHLRNDELLQPAICHPYDRHTHTHTRLTAVF